MSDALDKLRKLYESGDPLALDRAILIALKPGRRIDAWVWKAVEARSRSTVEKHDRLTEKRIHRLFAYWSSVQWFIDEGRPLKVAVALAAEAYAKYGKAKWIKKYGSHGKVSTSALRQAWERFRREYPERADSFKTTAKGLEEMTPADILYGPLDDSLFLKN
ncbi:MAG TPA: hypothetical protein VMD77_05560 [Candidatus Baltobacteraceae bacterium]|nr:hypothetical protein [Candidatus Baltobacteraceae bacterium]